MRAGRTAVSIAAFVAACALGAGAAAPVQAQQVIHVSVAGDDRNDGCCATAGASAGASTDASAAASAGTTAGPVRSLRRGLEIVRAARVAKAWPDGGFVLLMQPGRYRLSEPLALDAGVSGEPGAPVVIRASERARPRTVRIVGSVPLRAPDEAVPSAALGGGTAIRVPAAAAGVRLAASAVVTRDDRRLTTARWPNDGYARVNGVTGELVHLGGRVPATAGPVRLAGYPVHDWQFESLDAAGRSGDALRIADAANRVKQGARVVLTGAPELIDRPDEVVVDADANRVHLHPSIAGDAALEVSVVPSLVTGSGVRHLRFEGVALCNASSHALELQDVEQVELADAEVCNTGGWAVRLAGKASGVRDSHVHDVGEGGVYLFGGNRQDLTPGAMFVEHSVFEGLSRRVWSYGPAVYAEGVGGTVRGNVIRDAPHVAVMFSGVDQRIELNDISEVVKETGDMGAIYSGRDWTSRGHLIRGNLVYDVPGPGASGARGVYLDDQFSAATVENNLFANVANGVYIGGGRDNIVRHNLFFASDPAIHFDARGLDDARLISGNGPTLQRKLDEIPVDSPPYRERFPALARLRDENPMAPLGNVVADNLIVDGSPVLLYGRSARQYLPGPVGTRLYVRIFGSWSGRPQPQWVESIRAKAPAAADWFPWAELDAAIGRARAAR